MLFTECPFEEIATVGSGARRVSAHRRGLWRPGFLEAIAHLRQGAKFDVALSHEPAAFYVSAAALFSNVVSRRKLTHGSWPTQFIRISRNPGFVSKKVNRK